RPADPGTAEALKAITCTPAGARVVGAAVEGVAAGAGVPGEALVTVTSGPTVVDTELTASGSSL
ncbi:MAG TPA: hypothetical protein VF711_06680, partial [Acidimicrobiales bacterium]